MPTDPRSLTVIAGYIPITRQLADEIAAMREAERIGPTHGPHRADLPPGHRLLLELRPGQPAGTYRRGRRPNKPAINVRQSHPNN